jgi:hypothetical protein
VTIAVVVALSTAALVWWLDTAPAVEREPAPPPAVTSPSPAPSLPSASAPALAVDASAPPVTRTAKDVLLHVTREGRTAVGERVELARSDGGVVSGTVDTMGDVVLPLDDDTWTVRAPRYAQPSVLRIDADTPSMLALELTDSPDLRGRVLNAARQPVAGALVTASVKGKPPVSATSVSDGSFILPVTEGRVALHAALESQRSATQFVSAPAHDLELLLQPTFRYELVAVGRTPVPPRLVIRHAFGLKTCIGNPCVAEVPAGELRASVFSFDGQRTQAGFITEQVTGPSVRLLKLSPTPPLTGNLTDARGAPMPGVTLHLVRANLSQDDYLSPDFVPRLFGLDANGVTQADGSFSIEFPLDAFPLWVVVAGAPHELARRALVSPGEGPLSLQLR